MYKFFIIILIFSGSNVATSIAREEAKKVNILDKWEEYNPKPVPEIEFYDNKDEKHLLEEWDDNIIILHFWATWCTVCVKEIPELDRLKKDFRKEKLQIIAVSEDFKGSQIVEEFYKINQIKNLNIYIDKKNQLFNAFNIIGLPTTIFINKQNQEVARISGQVDWSDSELRKKILGIN